MRPVTDTGTVGGREGESESEGRGEGGEDRKISIHLTVIIAYILPVISMWNASNITVHRIARFNQEYNSNRERERETIQSIHYTCTW